MSINENDLVSLAKWVTKQQSSSLCFHITAQNIITESPNNVIKLCIKIFIKSVPLSYVVMADFLLFIAMNIHMASKVHHSECDRKIILKQGSLKYGTRLMNIPKGLPGYVWGLCSFHEN